MNRIGGDDMSEGIQDKQNRGANGRGFASKDTDNDNDNNNEKRNMMEVQNSMIYSLLLLSRLELYLRR